MPNPERATQIDAYIRTKSAYSDFPRFEGNSQHRIAEREAFINGEKYVPEYDYHKLNEIRDDEKRREKKTAIYEAVLELEAAKQEPNANVAELEIYAAFHEVRLKKMMLVEASDDLNRASTSSEWETAMRNFSTMNREVYGEFDTDTYMSMLGTESARLDAFKPTTDRAAAIKDQLRDFIGEVPAAQPEVELMDAETLGRLQDLILERYADVLSAVPDTDADVYYDAEECARIMNDAMASGGLAEQGWTVVVDPDKANPSTSTGKKKILLPSSTRRNAGELRRLIIHEQEVHARRGANGKDSGFTPLESGTADYADVEEGLGVLMECAVVGNWDNASFHRARDRYIVAGLAMGADGTARDARQVYETMWRMLAVKNAVGGDITDEVIENARQQAYVHVENAYRGTQFWMRGVVYSKLKVYYEGLRKNAEYFTENAHRLNEALDDAMIGKHDHTDSAERENIHRVLEAAA